MAPEFSPRATPCRKFHAVEQKNLRCGRLTSSSGNRVRFQFASSLPGRASPSPVPQRGQWPVGEIPAAPSLLPSAGARLGDGRIYARDTSALHRGVERDQSEAQAAGIAGANLGGEEYHEDLQGLQPPAPGGSFPERAARSRQSAVCLQALHEGGSGWEAYWQAGKIEVPREDFGARSAARRRSIRKNTEAAAMSGMRSGHPSPSARRAPCGLFEAPRCELALPLLSWCGSHRQQLVRSSCGKPQARGGVEGHALSVALSDRTSSPRMMRVQRVVPLSTVPKAKAAGIESGPRETYSSVPPAVPHGPANCAPTGTPSQAPAGARSLCARGNAQMVQSDSMRAASQCDHLNAAGA